ncbi:MAG: aminopeptidase P family protein [Rhizobiales bacterium]|nr:aminopeptidase P family protein [Hyphomicrobiales bacterium]
MTAPRLPPLSPSLRRIAEAEYPRFSDAEMQRRRTALETILLDACVDHAVFCGANRSGSAVQWLTQWPVTTEAVGVFSPGKPDALFVQYFNHVPLARKLANRADVAWGGESGIRAAVETLARRGAKERRVGVIGPMTFEQHAILSARFGTIANLNRAYVRLRMVKSAEEIEWLRIGAALSDAGMMGLRNGLQTGLTERELGDLVERAYVPHGGTNWIHFFGVTPMADPQIAVPAQFPSTRRVRKGDIVFAEISAAFWDHAGQVLRSLAVGEEPPPLYRDMHAVADAAFDAIAAVIKDGASPVDAIAASGVIEEAGFTTCDDLLHGYGGGYLPPILGSSSRPAGSVPEETFKTGMTIVIQPNVVTRDARAGVQTGELVLVTKDGIERMHTFPRGFTRI